MHSKKAVQSNLINILKLGGWEKLIRQKVLRNVAVSQVTADHYGVAGDCETTGVEARCFPNFYHVPGVVVSCFHGNHRGGAVHGHDISAHNT